LAPFTGVAGTRTETPLNIFRTLAHNPSLLRGFSRLGGYLLCDDVIPARQRELVILRTGWRCGSEYEFGQHTVIGRAAGLSDDEIERLTRDELDPWDDNDATLLRMCDELCRDDEVSGETWTALARTWSEPQLLQLLVLAGYYRLVSGLLNTTRVALEPRTPGWPRPGAARRTAPRDRGQS
jgi:alkylhydroperoxidase family enzyme